MSMSTLGPIIFAKGSIAAINFLKSKGLLASSMDCVTCGVPMYWVKHTVSACKDGWSWRPECATYKSIRTGSFFSKSKLTLQKWIHLIYLRSISMPVLTACNEAEVANKTAVDGYQWLREVCSTKLLTSPIKLGGPGTVVQADESLFNHKPKVKHINALIVNLTICDI